nr:MAG TPA: hypothetical protein [Caudoviricetes sp.]
MKSLRIGCQLYLYTITMKGVLFDCLYRKNSNF